MILTGTVNRVQNAGKRRSQTPELIVLTSLAFHTPLVGQKQVSVPDLAGATYRRRDSISSPRINRLRKQV
jgi:hypothetical protein